MAKRKTAMVAPPPAKPAHQLTLEAALYLAGNNRAYTVISPIGSNSWIVHFEGDIKSSMIMQVKGRWVIAQSE
jgi:hypothetical protein